jgi:hypothetical protein
MAASASSQISAPYFHLPVADMEDPADRERVYCYELYHHWRNHWYDNFPFSLNGELDKAKHPRIPNREKPDFLVHVPGQMTNMSNLLIVEVKPANAALKQMVDDMEKLAYFRTKLLDKARNPSNYHAAYFWLYHMEIDEWLTLAREAFTSDYEKDYGVRPEPHPMHHSSGVLCSRFSSIMGVRLAVSLPPFGA